MYGEGGGLGEIPRQDLGAQGGGVGTILTAQDLGSRADLQATYTAWSGSRAGGSAFPPL